MSWANVRLIFHRELRDQLRDRRTLFTVLVLPILLYPLLGMTFLQISQFLREHPTRIWVVGYDAERLAVDIPLFDGERLSNDLEDDSTRRLLEFRFDPSVPDELTPFLAELTAEPAPDSAGQPEREPSTELQQLLASQQVDLLVLFPDAESAAEGDATSDDGLATNEPPSTENQSPIAAEPGTPRVVLAGNLARDSSRVARQRVVRVLERWRDLIVLKTLARNRVSPEATRPFRLEERDLSAVATRRAAVWSKILPFVMLLWALTGAFYPAIDSCAGEKERGTLETMLCGPATRGEIVAGKLMTVVSFSAATSLLNLLSMMFSGALLIGAMPREGSMLTFGPPPLLALVWLTLALFPAAALFGSLALAIAVFARSSKEGQYYLMPLLMVSLPLLMIAMLPATELEWGTALIPLTGLMLLLRELIEGDYLSALTYAAPVLAITFGAVYASARWAVAQFCNESVIFRESEQIGLGVWLRHVMRDRTVLPSAGEALLCAVLILLIRFFGQFALAAPSSWNGFAVTTAVTLLAFVATPALLMALLLTRSPTRSLLLRWPGFTPLIVAPLLAVSLHPLLSAFGRLVVTVYEPGPEMEQLGRMLQGFFDQAPGLLSIVLVIAATPAICEELAFRGFVLAGFSSLRNKWAAIALSSFFFGVAHGLLQQSIVATFTGLVLGYVAFQTRSLLPAMLYHFVHNSLAVLIGHWGSHPEARPAWTEYLLAYAPAADVTTPTEYHVPA
ncbi:MAG TPA: CPBP family intramembrane metalloprotease domain-containing protein, partial [Planctomycetaceae bacterium]|nr:CPBP family intramembrane metalloprotease domain-containing protein [Planctomycetaceae bacterium]